MGSFTPAAFCYGRGEKMSRDRTPGRLGSSATLVGPRAQMWVLRAPRARPGAIDGAARLSVWAGCRICVLFHRVQCWKAAAGRIAALLV
ncbi:hypothetical protein BN2475_170011 [Paraburkholderia ribeironis]|uniref:Uncharacterized protein n=1 Tax=Paraburkholderia ribeironis TaxID=1247936 RepID=A0A1N7RUA9_9BURK|nr:hypothetical protein BN2475_170011 [Paraburkholderia ribeironis]